MVAKKRSQGMQRAACVRSGSLGEYAPAHACRISGPNDVVFSSRGPLTAGTVAALAGVAANRIA